MTDLTSIYSAADLNILKDAVVPLAAALLGAVVGAVVGYFPAKKLAKESSDELLMRDAEERRSQRARAARQVYVKIHTLANSIGSYHEQIEEMVQKAELDGNSHMRIFERLSTFPGIDREPSVDFTSDELEIFIYQNRPDYIDQLLLSSRRYSATLGHLAAFAKMKTDWHNTAIQFGETVRDENGVSRTRMRVPSNVANFINVQADELEFFTTEMRGLISEWTTYIFGVAQGFEEATVTLFDAGERPGFAPIDGTDALPDSSST